MHAMFAKFLSPHVDVVGKFGEEVPTQASSSSPYGGLKLLGPSPYTGCLRMPCTNLEGRGFTDRSSSDGYPCHQSISELVVNRCSERTTLHQVLMHPSECFMTRLPPD
ncbi:hypothetical protein TNCV_2188041 [Trichonephila clavipes]|nr:hypothetical protein TNCV_2188041 [Trichonephila clavipes]